MPGIHTVIGKIDERKLRDISEELLHEKHFTINVLDKSEKTCVLLSHYDGYPFRVWEFGPCKIVLDGMVYSYTDDEVEIRINDIAKRFLTGDDFQESVRDFVGSADGDYVILITNPNEKRLLVFNDYAGRIPVYYYADHGTFILGREIKFLVNAIPQPLHLNKISIVEYLLFEYTLGNKTLFHNLLRLESSNRTTHTSLCRKRE